jgi:hypothetical protein
MAGWYTQNLEKFYANEPHKLNGIMYKNALKLFPKLEEKQFGGKDTNEK